MIYIFKVFGGGFMLFKTIYGPEVKSIYFWILKYGPVENQDLYRIFLTVKNNEFSSPANLLDALSFLKTAGLIQKKDKYWLPLINLDEEYFLIILIKHIRELHLGKRKAEHALDPYFFGILNDLFIIQDIVFRSNIYNDANCLDPHLNFSKEKINAWKRVIEFLGLGKKGFKGIHIVYDPNMILKIINLWLDQHEGPLQDFLHNHLNDYIPWENKNKEISKSLSLSLKYLESKKLIKLERKQDLPKKSYQGLNNTNWIRKGW